MVRILAAVGTLSLLFAVVASCGETDDDPMEPTTGTVEVSVTTTGDDPDPDGYTVQVGTSHSSSVAADDSVTFSRVEPGSYEVQFTGVAENCRVQGQHPVTVRVTGGTTTTVVFTVICEAATGGLAISASTSGGDPDTTGYVVTVDGAVMDTIGPNGSTTFGELVDGDHRVELSDVQANCTVQGENPRTVPITPDSTSSTSFSVDCTAVTGDLIVSASTSGDSTDTDGYRLVLDGSDTTAVGTNDSLSYEGLSEGNHHLKLVDVEENCTVQGKNPRTVTVLADSTVRSAYAVDCGPRSGELVVDVETKGESRDSTGYTLTLDGSISTSVDSEDSVSFAEIDVGEHEIQLSDIADNCSVEGDNPRAVTVAFDSTTTESIVVQCAAVTGDLQILVQTSGDSADSDGYLVAVDGTRRDSVGPEGSVRFDDLPVGDHEVALSDVQPNCTVDRGNPRILSVAAGTTTTDSVTVDCEPALLGRIVFSSFRNDGNWDIYSLQRDGTGLNRLTTRSGQDREPAVSPDGTRIAFGSERGEHRDDEIAMLDLSRDSIVQLTDASGHDDQPAWSPDGDRLVFVSERSDSDGDLYIMDADGTDVRQVTTHPGIDGAPTWAATPSGEAIFFQSSRDGDSEIFRIRPDGTELEQITHNTIGDEAPSVSPDGSTLAFARGFSISSREICVMDVDGLELECLTDNSVSDANPSWSPDGEYIAFQSRFTGDRDIFVMDVDGENLSNLTRATSLDTGPSWTPER